MSQESKPTLADAGIFKSAAGGCSCGGSKVTYRLPIRISDPVLPFFLQFGEPSSDITKSHLIIINTDKYKITAIKRLKDIEFTLKRQGSATQQQAFESALINMVQSVAKEKK